MEQDFYTISQALDNLAQIVEVSGHATIWDRIAVFAPIAILISVFAALYGVHKHHQVAKIRATLDLIEKVESSEHYQALHAAFKKRRKANTISELSFPKEAHDFAERTQVFAYLNHYELVALGIKKKILDEKFYRGWMQTNFLDDWVHAEEFIQRERWKQHRDRDGWVYQATLYEHYNEIAKRWSPNRVTLLSESKDGPPTSPSGPGDEPKVGVGG